METQRLQTRSFPRNLAHNALIVRHPWNILFVVAVLGGTFAGCNSGASKSGDEPTDADSAFSEFEPIADITPQELARRTAEAYHSATSLEYEVRVTQSNYPTVIDCKVKHGLNERVELAVFDDGKLVFELNKSPVENGVRVVEINHRGEERADYVVTLAEAAYDRWDLRCKQDVDGCLFGMHLLSWVGPGSHWPSFFEEIVSTAESVGLDEIEGRRCYSVKTTRMANLDERLWIDTSTFAVLRWKQVIGGVERDRIFSNVVLRKGVIQTAKNAD